MEIQPSFDPNIPKNKHGVRTKIILSIVGLLVLCFIALGLYVSYNPKTKSFSCDYAEIEVPISPELKDAYIIFDRPIYGGENVDFSEGCVGAYTASNHKVNLLSGGQDSLTPTQFASGTEFTIFNRVYIACQDIGCMDQGGGGDTLLLKDKAGKIWSINVGDFNQNYVSAGYYKNGQRLGRVHIDNYSPDYPDSYNSVKWIK